MKLRRRSLPALLVLAGCVLFLPVLAGGGLLARRMLKPAEGELVYPTGGVLAAVRLPPGFSIYHPPRPTPGTLTAVQGDERQLTITEITRGGPFDQMIDREGLPASVDWKTLAVNGQTCKYSIDRDGILFVLLESRLLVTGTGRWTYREVEALVSGMSFRATNATTSPSGR